MSARGFFAGAAPAALGSLVALAAQALMALFLLHLFEPTAVGVFSLVAQTAFGWATLALAQSPLSLLANQHLGAVPATRQAWRASLRRWLWLSPLALLALAWAGLQREASAALPTLALWAGATALAQMGWLLAQSLALRVHTPASIAGVRLLPPVLAALLVGLGAGWWPQAGSALLLGAALAGYLAGTLWLRPLWTPAAYSDQPPADAGAAQLSATGDARSEQLKLLHSASDVLVATALAAHWTALYGVAQAGCLLVLLRVFGFVPALVGSAWAQVALSRPQAQRPSSLWAAVAGVLGVAGLAGLAWLALEQAWLAPPWQALRPYVLPLALWQAAASLMAAASHRPFQQGRAQRYTWQCLGINAGQALLLLLPPLWGWGLPLHLWVLCAGLTLALAAQAAWSARLGR